jgi:hypothetical protein
VVESTSIVWKEQEEAPDLDIWRGAVPPDLCDEVERSTCLRQPHTPELGYFNWLAFTSTSTVSNPGHKPIIIFLPRCDVHCVDIVIHDLLKFTRGQHEVVLC